MTINMDFSINVSGPKPKRLLLALESSTSLGGAALMAEGAVLETITLEEGLRHGRDLLPAAESLLKNHHIRPQDLYGLAVSIGPGSYTGVRVGVMSAKAFAFAAPCCLTGVSSLAALAQTALAHNPDVSSSLVMTVQDARRDEVYIGLYHYRDGIAQPLFDDAAVTPEEAAAQFHKLKESGKKLIPAGGGFSTYSSLFADPADAVTVAPGAIHPSAAAVAFLGWRQLLQEKIADPLHFEPVYLRRDPDADWTRDCLIAP